MAGRPLRDIVGGTLSTTIFTVEVGQVEDEQLASKAFAVMGCVPLLKVLVLSEKEYLFVPASGVVSVTGAPPSTLNSTFVTPRLSVASAVTVIVPF